MNYETLTRIFDAITNQKERMRFDPGLQLLHYTQKYYIDHGENDDFFFPLANTLQTTEEVIDKLKEDLQLENIIHFLVPKEKLSYMTQDPPDLLSRLRYPLVAFHGSKGGLNKDYVRSIRVSPSFIAERLASVVPDTGGGSVINIITTGTGNASNKTTINVNQGNGGDQNIESCKPTECTDKGVPLGMFLGSIGKRNCVSRLCVCTKMEKLYLVLILAK